MSAAIQIKAPPADPPGSPSAGASAELKTGGQPGPSSSLAPSRPSSPRGLTLPLPLGLPSPAVLDTAGLKMCRNELIHGCVCLADGSSALRAAPAEGAVLILGACPRRPPCDTSSCKYEDDGCLFYHPSVRPLLAPCSHAGLGLTSQLAASSLAEADPVDAGAEHAEVRPWTISPPPSSSPREPLEADKPSPLPLPPARPARRPRRPRACPRSRSSTSSTHRPLCRGRCRPPCRRSQRPRCLSPRPTTHRARPSAS